MTDFFSKPEPAQPMQPTEPATTVKVGEKEYTQDELSQLVGLGETAREYEQKWDRKIDTIYPRYLETTAKLSEYERQRQAQEQQQLQQKAQEGQLTPEEARQLALQQAKDLGIVTNDIFQDQVNQAVANAMAGQELINDSRSLLAEQTQKGLPNVELTDLLAYMNGNNPTGTRFGTPEMAYNDMFSNEISAQREQNLNSIRPQGMVTNAQSQGGNVLPAATPPSTREALTKAINEVLTRGRGGGA